MHPLVRWVLVLGLGWLAFAGWGVAQTASPPLTVEAVAADERLWPREVVTKSASVVVVDGRQVTVPAGEMVRLVRVERETVLVQFRGLAVRLPASQTDLLAGAHTRRVQQGISAPPPVAAATPVVTRPAEAQPSVAAPTPKNLSLPEPTPLTRKAQTDRVVRTVIAREGVWILGLLGALAVVAIVAKRFIES